MFDFLNFIGLLGGRLTQHVMVGQISQILLCLDPDPAPKSSPRLSTGDFQKDRMFFLGGQGEEGAHDVTVFYEESKVTYFAVAFGEKTRLLKELKVLW